MNQAEKTAFNKQYWRFLISSILIALSGCLGNVVDAIIVGNFINEDAVSAINLSKPVIQFMFTLSMLVATGAAMLVGMEIGKKNMARAAYIYTLSITLSLAIGFMLTACGLLIPDTVTGWLCDNRQLYQPTYDYLRVMLLGAPAYMMMWGINMMVSVDGSPRLVSFAIIIDNAVNLSLDILFIKLLGWGIQGSSTATVVGHLVGITIMSRHYLQKDNHLLLVFKDTLPLSSGRAGIGLALHQIISQGAPLAIASVCLTLLLFSANNIVLSSLGRNGIFAFALCMNLLQIYNLFLSGVCRTIQSLGAIQVGKGDDEAFRLLLRKAFRFITLAMVSTCGIVWIAPQAIARLFGADEAELIAQGSHALRILSLSFIPFCYIYVLMIVYKLYKCHKMALFISFALSLTVIPVMLCVAKLAPQQLWYSYLIAYTIEALLIILLHRLNHVKFSLITRHP